MNMSFIKMSFFLASGVFMTWKTYILMSNKINENEMSDWLFHILMVVFTYSLVKDRLLSLPVSLYNLVESSKGKVRLRFPNKE